MGCILPGMGVGGVGGSGGCGECVTPHLAMYPWPPVSTVGVGVGVEETRPASWDFGEMISPSKEHLIPRSKGAQSCKPN